MKNPRCLHNNVRILDFLFAGSAIFGMQTLQPFPLLSFHRFLMIQIAPLPFLLCLFPETEAATFSLCCSFHFQRHFIYSL